MNRLSALNQMIIAGVLIVAVAVVAVVFGILPMLDKASVADTRLAELDQEISTAQALVDRRESVKAQAAQTEVDLIRLASQVPESPDLPTLIINLQDTANAAGLVFAQITPGEPKAAAAADLTSAGYSIVPVEVKLEGSWADMIEYVRKLAKYPRGLRITTASFSNVDASVDRERYVEAQIRLEVYTMSVINVNTISPPITSTPPTSSVNTTPTQ